MTVIQSPEDEIAAGQPLVQPLPPESRVPTSRPWIDYINMIKNLIADVDNPHLTARQRSVQAAILIWKGLSLLENLADTFKDEDRLQKWVDEKRDALKALPPPRLKLESATSQGIRVLKIKSTDATMNEDAPSESLGPFAVGQLLEQAHEAYLNSLLALVADVVTELTVRKLLPMDLEKEEDDDWDDEEDDDRGKRVDLPAFRLPPRPSPTESDGDDLEEDEADDA